MMPAGKIRNHHAFVTLGDPQNEIMFWFLIRCVSSLQKKFATSEVYSNMLAQQNEAGLLTSLGSGGQGPHISPYLLFFSRTILQFIDRSFFPFLI